MNELPHLYWNKTLDSYIKTHKMSCEDYEEMSPFQQGVIQELKKHFKRTSLLNKKKGV